MTGSVNPRRQGSYGIDAPYWVAVFAVMIAANVVLRFTGMEEGMIPGDWACSVPCRAQGRFTIRLPLDGACEPRQMR
jgi:hypothetical protein